MNKLIRMPVLVLCLALLPSLRMPLYADSCNDAKSSAEKYLDMYEHLRSMSNEEQKAFIKAACDADDEKRAEVMKDVGERVQSEVLSQADELKESFADAKEKLQAAIDDDACKDDKSDLTDMQERVVKISERIETISNGVRAGNNPVFAALRDLGQQAHKEYQSMNSSFNNARSAYGNAEVSLDEISRRVDFMDPKGCQVVELKPDSNSSARSEGFDDAKKARDWLNDPKNFADFVEKYPAYANCKKFVARVDCYHYCPGVADDGSLQLGSIDWKTGCEGPN